MHSPPVQPSSSSTSGTGSVITMWLEVTVSRRRSGRWPASAGPAASTAGAGAHAAAIGPRLDALARSRVSRRTREPSKMVTPRC